MSVFEKGHSLAIVASLLQSTTWQLIRSSKCTFSHMTYLMRHVTYFNNKCG